MDKSFNSTHKSAKKAGPGAAYDAHNRSFSQGVGNFGTEYRFYQT